MTAVPAPTIVTMTLTTTPAMTAAGDDVSAAAGDGVTAAAGFSSPKKSTESAMMA